MKEIIKAFFETSRERLKNPFIGAFLLSWIAVNWKPIVILIASNNKIEDRILLIEQNHSQNSHVIFIPLIITFVYVLLLPYVMWLIDEIINKSIIGRKSNANKLLAVDLKGKQKLAIEENKLEDIRASYKEKADLNLKINNLKKQLEEKSKIIDRQRIEQNTLNEDYTQLKLIVEKDKTSELSDEELKKLEDEYINFKNSDLYDFFREIGLSIRNSNAFPNSLNEIIKEKYLYNNIVNQVIDEENRQSYYEFTDKGHFYWKEYIMSLKVTKRIPPPPPSEPDDLPF